METTSRAFVANAREGLQDANLQRSLARFQGGFQVKRVEAAKRLPEFEALRDQARAIKDHALAHLDHYLERFEEQVTAAGGTVHWCQTPADARRVILTLCQDAGARTVTKSKSMIAEEMELNPFLEEHGIEPIETDLGEYVVQLADERPSHIIAPAVHKTKDKVADLFHEKHTPLGRTRRLDRVEELVEEAREVLRPRYLAADAGITGANFLIAETGSSAGRDQRGKCGPHPDPAARPHRHRDAGEGGADAGGRDHDHAGARALGDGPGVLHLHHGLDRPAPARRCRWARGLSRRAARQRPLADAGLRVPRGAPLHQVRRLHEPLPGVRLGGRPRVRLGLSWPGRRGADAESDRAGRIAPPAQRIELLWPLRGGPAPCASPCRG